MFTFAALTTCAAEKEPLREIEVSGWRVVCNSTARSASVLVTAFELRIVYVVCYSRLSPAPLFESAAGHPMASCPGVAVASLVSGMIMAARAGLAKGVKRLSARGQDSRAVVRR